MADIEETAAQHLEAAFRLRTELPGSSAAFADLGREAAVHLAHAGRRAFGRDDVSAAANLFSRAIDCLPSGAAEVGELSRLRGAALFDLGRFDEAEAALAVGLTVAESSDDQALTWRLQIESVHAVTYLRPSERSAGDVLAFAEEASRALERLGDVAGVARAERLRGEALSLLGRQEDALDAYVTGWTLAQQAGDERELALRPQPTGVHGPTPLDVVISQCERLTEESGRPRPETLMRLALALALHGDDSRSVDAMERGLELAREVGGAFRVADAEVYAGACDLYGGRPDRARLHLTTAVSGLRQIGERSVRSTAVALLGEALFRVGALDDAIEAVEESRNLAADDDQATQMAWRQVYAKVALARGDLDAARTHIEQASEIAATTDFLVMGALVEVDHAAILHAAGEPAAAERALHTATDRLADKRARRDLPAIWNPAVAGLLRSRVT
jgi:tetratricopeptide (TPR) repeat protein